MNLIVVLSDGETWADLDGCSVLALTDKQYFDLWSGKIRIQDIEPQAEIGLSEETTKDVD